MSDIERFIWASAVTPAVGGDWVRYTDHQAEVEQLTRQRSENFAEIERLTRARDGLRDNLREALEERNDVRHEAVELREKLGEARAEMERLKEQVGALTVAVEQANEAKADAEAAAAAEEAETDQLTCERDVAQAEVQRLVQELGGRSATNQQIIAERDAARAEVERVKEQVRALTLAVEQADEMKAHAEAAAAAEEAETDRVMAERDAAQRERERVQDLLTLAGRELSTLREALRVRRRDQSAQNLDMVANCKETLTSSRPTDEDIWREAFMSQLHDRYGEASELAEVALAGYRKRWPR